MSCEIVKWAQWEDQDAICMARLKIRSGSTLANIQQSDVTSISYKVFDVTDEDDTTPEEVASGDLTPVTSFIYDALQTGTLWTEAGGDATGYNFLATIPFTAFPDGAKTYRVEIKLTMAAGGPRWVVGEGKTRQLHTS